MINLLLTKRFLVFKSCSYELCEKVELILLLSALFFSLTLVANDFSVFDKIDYEVSFHNLLFVYIKNLERKAVEWKSI